MIYSYARDTTCKYNMKILPTGSTFIYYVTYLICNKTVLIVVNYFSIVVPKIVQLCKSAENSDLKLPFVVVKVISISSLFSSAPEIASVLSTLFNGSSLPVERHRRFRSDLVVDVELLAELHVDDTDEDRTIVGPR